MCVQNQVLMLWTHTRIYELFALQIDKEWRVVTAYTKQYLAEHPELGDQNHDGIEESRPLEFDERQHKMLNSELKFLYTALTRAKCNLWIYDSNRAKRAPMFHYFQKRDLVKIVSVPSSGTGSEDGSTVESMIAAVSSADDWKKQGDYFKKRCLWDLAILCYSKAGMPELTREVKAYSCVLMGKKYKHDVKKMKEYFVTATLNFFECLKFQPSAKWIENAAVCLFNAREYDLAAPLFGRLGQVKKLFDSYSDLPSSVCMHVCVCVVWCVSCVYASFVCLCVYICLCVYVSLSACLVCLYL